MKNENTLQITQNPLSTGYICYLESFFLSPFLPPLIADIRVKHKFYYNFIYSAIFILPRSYFFIILQPRNFPIINNITDWIQNCLNIGEIGLNILFISLFAMVFLLFLIDSKNNERRYFKRLRKMFFIFTGMVIFIFILGYTLSMLFLAKLSDL